MSAKSCRPKSDQTPHKPESRSALGALHRLHAAVVFGKSGGGGVEKVGRVLQERLEAMGFVAVEDEGAETGDEQHLVRVPDDAVRPFQTRHQVAVPLAQNGRSPVSCVHVEPYSVLGADVGDLVQRVEGPRGRGASAGHHGHDRLLPACGYAVSSLVQQMRGPSGRASSRPTRTT